MEILGNDHSTVEERQEARAQRAFGFEARSGHLPFLRPASSSATNGRHCGGLLVTANTPSNFCSPLVCFLSLLRHQQEVLQSADDVASPSGDFTP